MRRRFLLLSRFFSLFSFFETRDAARESSTSRHEREREKKESKSDTKREKTGNACFFSSLVSTPSSRKSELALSFVLVSFFIFFFPLTMRRRVSPLVLLVVAAAAAVSLAGGATATAASPPFVNWSVLREGAPREEHVQALQLAKVREIFSFFSFFFFQCGGLLLLLFFFRSPCRAHEHARPCPLQRIALARAGRVVDSVSRESAVAELPEEGSRGRALANEKERRKERKKKKTTSDETTTKTKESCIIIVSRLT